MGPATHTLPPALGALHRPIDSTGLSQSHAQRTTHHVGSHCPQASLTAAVRNINAHNKHMAVELVGPLPHPGPACSAHVPDARVKPAAAALLSAAEPTSCVWQSSLPVGQLLRALTTH